MSDHKILVIDDEPDSSELVYLVLKPHYPNVSHVNDPKIAAELIKSEKYCLIISDIHMPEIPGHELVRMLRCQGKLNPVMFMTGHLTKELLLTAIRLGVSDFLEKPYQVENLIETVNRVIEIDRRKTQLILDSSDPNVPPERLAQQRKMLGLLHVLNDKKNEKKKAS